MGAVSETPKVPHTPHMQDAEDMNDLLLSGKITADLPPPTSPMPAVVREANGRFRRGAPSPNPSGRAIVAPEVRDAARAHTADMLAVLVEVAMDGSAPSAARIAAANAVLDRGHGRPIASLEAKIAKVDIGAMHLEALRTLSDLPPLHAIQAPTVIDRDPDEVRNTEAVRLRRT